MLIVPLTNEGLAMKFYFYLSLSISVWGILLAELIRKNSASGWATANSLPTLYLFGILILAFYFSIQVYKCMKETVFIAKEP